VVSRAALGWSDSGPTVPDFVDCAVFPPSRTAVYVLPYPVGDGFRVNRAFDHYTTPNGGVGPYAIDFPMRIGPRVHASRAGTVVAVEEPYYDDDHADFHENWVMIRHGDNSMARFIHLTTSMSRPAGRTYRALAVAPDAR